MGMWHGGYGRFKCSFMRNCSPPGYRAVGSMHDSPNFIQPEECWPCFVVVKSHLMGIQQPGATCSVQRSVATEYSRLKTSWLGTSLAGRFGCYIWMVGMSVRIRKRSHINLLVLYFLCLTFEDIALDMTKSIYLAPWLPVVESVTPLGCKAGRWPQPKSFHWINWILQLNSHKWDGGQCWIDFHFKVWKLNAWGENTETKLFVSPLTLSPILCPIPKLYYDDFMVIILLGHEAAEKGWSIKHECTFPGWLLQGPAILVVICLLGPRELKPPCCNSVSVHRADCLPPTVVAGFFTKFLQWREHWLITISTNSAFTTWHTIGIRSCEKHRFSNTNYCLEISQKFVLKILQGGMVGLNYPRR